MGVYGWPQSPDHEGHEVTGRKRFVVHADHGRLSRESREIRSDSDGRRPALSHFEKDSPDFDEINWFVLLDAIPVDASFEGGTLTHTPSNFVLLGPGVAQADSAVEVGFTNIHQTGLQATDLLK